MSPEELYSKIKAKYPELELDRETEIEYPPHPPLSEKQLELLEAGFQVEIIQ